MQSYSYDHYYNVLKTITKQLKTEQMTYYRCYCPGQPSSFPFICSSSDCKWFLSRDQPSNTFSPLKFNAYSSRRSLWYCFISNEIFPFFSVKKFYCSGRYYNVPTTIFNKYLFIIHFLLSIQILYATSSWRPFTKS